MGCEGPGFSVISKSECSADAADQAMLPYSVHMLCDAGRGCGVDHSGPRSCAADAGSRAGVQMFCLPRVLAIGGCLLHEVAPELDWMLPPASASC